MKDILTLKFIISVIAVLISFSAFLMSFYIIYRDRANRQFDMLNKIILNISNLNRSIAETMLIEGDEDLKQKQKNVFLTELKNQYEFLAFLINRKQINSKHIIDIEKKFIKKFAQQTQIMDENYPEIHTLLASWRKK